MWTSPDPAGQFFSPYATSGNPVNFLEPDGMKEIDPCTDVGLGPGDWYAGDNASMGDAMVYWAHYADENFMDNFAYGASQLAYWNLAGNNYEGAYLERQGRILGPYQGESAATMGQEFLKNVHKGDRFFHIHTDQAYKRGLLDYPGELSAGDLAFAQKNELYMMEVDGGKRWFAGPGTKLLNGTTLPVPFGPYNWRENPPESNFKVKK